MGFFDFMTEDIAIDLGTANTLIIHDGKVVIDAHRLLLAIEPPVKLLPLVKMPA